MHSFIKDGPTVQQVCISRNVFQFYGSAPPLRTELYIFNCSDKTPRALIQLFTHNCIRPQLVIVYGVVSTTGRRSHTLKDTQNHHDVQLYDWDQPTPMFPANNSHSN